MFQCLIKSANEAPDGLVRSLCINCVRNHQGSDFKAFSLYVISVKSGNQMPAERKLGEMR